MWPMNITHVREYVQLCCINYATFLNFFQSFMLIWQEKSHFGYICKAVNCGYKIYVICVSQTILGQSWPISEIDCHHVIFCFSI